MAIFPRLLARPSYFSQTFIESVSRSNYYAINRNKFVLKLIIMAVVKIIVNMKGILQITI